MGVFRTLLPMSTHRNGCMAVLVFVAQAIPVSAAKPDAYSTVPPDAWMVFSAPDVAGAHDALSQTAVYRSVVAFLESPIVAAIPTYRELLRQRQIMERDLGFSLDTRSLARMISAVDVILLPPSDDGDPLSACVFHAADENRTRRVFEYLRRRMVEQVSSGTAASAGIRYDLYEGVDVISTRAGSGAAMAEIPPGRFVFANRPEAIHRLIDQSRTRKGLREDARFRKAIGGLKETEPHGFLYLNTERAGPSIRKAGLPGFPATAFFRSIRGGVVIAADFHIERNAVRFESFLPFDDPRRDPLAAIYRHSPPGRLKSLDFISTSPLFFTARNTIDGLSIYEGLRSIVLRSIGQMLPPGDSADAKIESAEKQFRDTMGFSLKDDLAPAIGPEAYIGVEEVRFDPLAPVPVLEVVAGIEIRDAERMARVLAGTDKFLDRELRRAGAPRDPRTGEGHLRTIRHSDSTIRWFPAPNPLYTVAYAKAGGFVLVGLGPDSIKHAIDRSEGKSEGFRSGYLQERLGRYLHESMNEVLLINVQKLAGVGREVANRFLKSSDPEQARGAQWAVSVLERIESAAAVGASTAAGATGLHTRGAVIFRPAPTDEAERP